MDYGDKLWSDQIRLLLVPLSLEKHREHFGSSVPSEVRASLKRLVFVSLTLEISISNRSDYVKEALTD